MSKQVDGRSTPKVKKLRSELFKRLRAEETAARQRRLKRSMKRSVWTNSDTLVLKKAYRVYKKESATVKLFIHTLLKYTDVYSKETGDKLLRASRKSPTGRAVEVVEMLIRGEICQHCNIYAAEYLCHDCRKIPELREQFVDWFVGKRENTLTERYGEGVTNPMHLKEVKQTISNMLLQRYGVTHNAKRPEVREATSKRLKNPDEHKKLMDGMERKHGVRNAMQVKGSVEKCAKTWAEHYEHGHPLRDPEIFARVCSSSKRFTELQIGGRLYKYQGYEGYVLLKLAERYGEEDVIGQLMFKKDRWRRMLPYFKVNKSVYYPDMGIRSLKLLIEVKSVYTFCEASGAFEATRRKVNAVEKANRKIAVVVALPRKDKYVVLPKEWIRWTHGRVQRYIHRRGIPVRGL